MPVSIMVSWMIYGKAVCKQEGGMARVIWAGDGYLRFLGQPIELGQFRQAAGASIDEAEALLEGLIFGN